MQCREAIKMSVRLCQSRSRANPIPIVHGTAAWARWCGLHCMEHCCETAIGDRKMIIFQASEHEPLNASHYPILSPSWSSDCLVTLGVDIIHNLWWIWIGRRWEKNPNYSGNLPIDNWTECDSTVLMFCYMSMGRRFLQCEATGRSGSILKSSRASVLIPIASE